MWLKKRHSQITHLPPLIKKIPTLERAPQKAPLFLRNFRRWGKSRLAGSVCISRHSPCDIDYLEFTRQCALFIRKKTKIPHWCWPTIAAFFFDDPHDPPISTLLAKKRRNLRTLKWHNRRNRWRENNVQHWNRGFPRGWDSLSHFELEKKRRKSWSTPVRKKRMTEAKGTRWSPKAWFSYILFRRFEVRKRGMLFRKSFHFFHGKKYCQNEGSDAQNYRLLPGTRIRLPRRFWFGYTYFRLFERTYKGKLPRELLRFCSEKEAAKATDLNSEMAASHPQNDQTVLTIFISKQIFAPAWGHKKKHTAS